MDEFDKYIRENAFYDFKEGLKSCDIGDILENFTLKEIGSGSNTRVYITEDKKWVIKEGRWDLSLSTFKYLGLQFTPALTEQLVKTIDIEFMPTKEHTVNQYKTFSCLLSTSDTSLKMIF